MSSASVKKGEILQHPGDLNSKIYIVKTGLLRSYTIDDKGKEHIYLFAPENWIVADSTPAGEKGVLFIDALEDAEVLILEKDEEEPDAKKLLNRMVTLQNRIIMLMSATGIERYEDFVNTYPDIVQRVPQRMIASYLGLTPEALSKVKGDRKRNG